MTREVSGRHSQRYRGFPMVALAVLLLVGCFNGADVGTIYCVTNDNCPAGYICADSSKPGGCRKKADVALDGGAFDTSASYDGTSSRNEVGGVDVTLGDRMDVALGNVDVSLVADGPMSEAPADIPQLLPDSTDSYVADVPSDPAGSETRLDGLPPVGGIDGSTGGAVGSGGAIGTGGATGSGGGAGSCGSRDCTSSKDNDCNGTADNQEAPCKVCTLGLGQACASGSLGICAAGTQTCQLATDHQSVGWGACLQTLAKATRDCTSSNDNDCNGQPDNAESTFCQCPAGGSPRACSTGLSGICAAGSQACVLSADKSSSTWGTCTQSTPKGTETCANSGTDDNCDGIVDNVPVSSCNVEGIGFAACANGGNTACSGTTQVCNPAASGIGDSGVWHLVAAPNGSWDWDCDGYVTKRYADTAPPSPNCDGLDINACSAVTPVEYSLSGPQPCGQVIDTVGSSYCYWLSVASACEAKTGQQTGQQQGCR